MKRSAPIPDGRNAKSEFSYAAGKRQHFRRTIKQKKAAAARNGRLKQPAFHPRMDGSSP